MNILLIGGSTAAHSKSEYLLEYIQQRFLNNPQISVKRINPSDFNPGHLINYDFQSTDVIDFQQAVYRADVIYISTPVYQAAYSGALKLLLDLIPQNGLQNKTLVPLAVGGSPAHLLVLDYALKPVLANLGASLILPSVFATSSEFTVKENGITQLSNSLNQRLLASVDFILSADVNHRIIFNSFRIKPGKEIAYSLVK